MYTRWIRWLVIVAVLGVMAPLSAQERTTAKEELRCVGIRVTSPELQQGSRRGRAGGRRDASFSAAEIVDLEFQVLFPREVTGMHQLNLKVYTPQGHLYQNISVPFDAGPFEVQEESQYDRGSAGDRRRRPTKRYSMITERLPVAGTYITNHSMYGRWSVEAYLDKSLKPCCSKLDFEITR
jgi:hypothetical protein